jgi:hypothetical protein
MQHIARSGLRAWQRGFCASALLTLAGCAVATPFALDSTGQGVPARAVVALPAEAAAGSDQARLAAALQRAFSANAVSTAKDGRYLADFAVSLRDAAGGLTTSTEAVDEQAIDWQAHPRNRRLLDGCTAQRMRATLVLFDRQSGEMVYRGQGEATDCGFSDEAMDEVASALVADALGRFGG